MAKSIYQIQALADIARKYLTTAYGEYLILTSTSNYDLDALEKALETGKYEASFRLFLFRPAFCRLFMSEFIDINLS